jgi:hypothetical protein
VVTAPKASAPPPAARADTHRAESPRVEAPTADAIKAEAPSRAEPKAAPPEPVARRRPGFVVDAVRLMAGDTPEGKVLLSPLGQYLRRTDPAFSPQVYGHSGLLEMLRCYERLTVQQEPGGGWSVRSSAKADGEDAAEAGPPATP